MGAGCEGPRDTVNGPDTSGPANIMPSSNRTLKNSRSDRVDVTPYRVLYAIMSLSIIDEFPSARNRPGDQIAALMTCTAKHGF